MSTASGSRNKQYKKSALDDRKLDISKEEFERIREALDKEEFRKLFFDYVDEIQDPENRKLYEQEITQFEKERGVDVTFIHPKPGFVIKTSIDGERKCFVNIASCPDVAAPKNEAALNPETGARGLSWSIPLAQTPPRDDIDAKQKRCKVFDVVFHPDALYLSQRNSDFRKCLIETALDAVEREFQVKLDRANLKYPKLEYKGMARPTVIRKLVANPTNEQCEPHPLDHVSPAKPTAESGKPKVLPMKTKSVSRPEYATPKYLVKHCHDVDLAEHTYELDAKLNTTVPRSLLVVIELPLLKSTADCELDVTSDSIYFLSKEAGAKYRLKLDLPYAVNDKAGNARFDTDLRRLCIKLPVVRSNAAQERELHDVLRNFSREDSGVELHSNSESPVEEDDADTELSDSTEEQTKGANTDDSANTTPTTTPVHSPRKFLKDSIHYQFPAKFDCNVLDNVMSFVLHVRNVQPDSIDTLKQSQCLHLQFSSIGSGYYPTHYAFFVQLPTEVNFGDLRIETAEAEAWENNLVLTLNLNVSSEQLQSYLAGLHAEDLKQYKLHTKIKLNSNDRLAKLGNTPQGPIASNLNVTVKRTECESSVSIEIKPNKESTYSSCAANTTEDDDDESQKKQSKKQRKRNKKRRSLSESACDDLKAIEGMEQHVNQQQKQQHNQSVANDLFNNDEDSSPERIAGENVANQIPMQRKQRSYSECHDSVTASSVGSGTSKGILKRFSRYGPRPSISDSCSSIDECHSSYSRSVDAGVNIFSQSFGGIPEEERNDDGLSESCKKTVRFNDHIMKQVFRLDSSILGQRKKNQKRRDRKLRALQRRVSEGDSADYEDSHNHKPASITKYFKANCIVGDVHDNKKVPQHDSGLDLSAATSNHNEGGNLKQSAKKSNKKQTKRERDHFESDTESMKNSMMFEMDDDI